MPSVVLGTSLMRWTAKDDQERLLVDAEAQGHMVWVTFSRNRVGGTMIYHESDISEIPFGMLFAAHCCPILCKVVNMFAASVCFSRSTMPMDVHDSFGDCLEARRIASATSLDVGIICQCQFMLPSCTNALSLCVRRPMKMWLRQHVAFWRTGFLSFASFIHLLVKRPRRR